VCNSYGVTFTMMSKVEVTGVNQEPVYQWLTQESRNCVQNAPVTWNFCKYLINEDGSWYAFKTPATSPMHSSIIHWITSQASVEENPSNHGEISVFFNEENQLQINIHVSSQQEMKIVLHSITGQLVSQVFNGMIFQNQEIIFNTTHLRAGIYILKAEFKTGSYLQKIVIAK